MKRLFPIILVAVVIAVSCTRREILPGYPHWMATGNAEFDSLTVEAIGQDCNMGASRGTVDSMVQIADMYPHDALMHARAIYFRYTRDEVERLLKHGDFNGLLAESFALDSARYPHDYNMLKWKLYRQINDFSTRYRKLTECRSFFESVGDSVYTGKILLDLCNIFLRMDDMEKVKVCVYEADDFFNVTGGEICKIKNKVNIAMISPRPQADSLFSALLNNRVIKNDSNTYMTILTNYYLCNDSLPLLLKAREISLKLADVDGSRINRQFLYLRWLLDHRRLAAAETEMRGLRKLIDTVNTPKRFIPLSLMTIADYYHAIGRSDSSDIYLREALRWQDSLNSEMRRDDVMAAQARINIARSEVESRERLVRQRLWFMLGVAILMIVFLTVLYVLYRRQARRRIRYVNTQSELRAIRYKMNAHVTAIEDKNKLITEIKEIASDASTGELHDKIGRVLKLHGTTSGEVESLMITHDELNVDFARRLKRDYPTLVESQLRLASYIAAGMSNHMIAKLMSIEQSSVKKSRWRLRTKLGLNTGDSLEDFLRHYNA